MVATRADYGLFFATVIWSCICFVLANIAIPKDESAMTFMLELARRRIDAVERAALFSTTGS